MNNYIAIVILSLCSYIAQATDNESAEVWLQKLDSTIAQTDRYEKDKSDIISMLIAQRDALRDINDIYSANSTIYDQCCTFDSDLAMEMVEANERIARQIGDKNMINEWLIKRAFMMSVTGMLMESNAILDGINASGMSRDMRVKYYTQKVYLYSHFGQYVGKSSQHDQYDKNVKAYRDSLARIMVKTDYDYIWYQTMKAISKGTLDSIKTIIDKIDISDELNTKADASNAYAMSQIYKKLGNKEQYIKYLAMSSIADLRVANKDIASLEELADVIYDQKIKGQKITGMFAQRGDENINRAYNYINMCLRTAQKFHNRVRVVSISRIQDNIHKAFVERDIEQRESLRSALWTATALLVMLALAIVMVILMYRKTKIVNSKLENAVSTLKNMNIELEESNYVKEEYIGYVFSICSNYISKIDEYRKNINRKMKVNQFDEVMAMTDKSNVQEEMQKFYKDFDAIFLHIYPDFVNDFNTLLLPEERIEPKKGELLNTDLRIFALVRLGINDSVKIAELLHCSPQTVYNNRLKIRNKAIVAKENFAEQVQKLGRKELK